MEQAIRQSHKIDIEAGTKTESEREEQTELLPETVERLDKIKSFLVHYEPGFKDMTYDDIVVILCAYAARSDENLVDIPLTKFLPMKGTTSDDLLEFARLLDENEGLFYSALKEVQE